MESKKILIVDDDKNVIQALRLRLQGAGYQVVCAEDGLTGVSMAVKHRPDLVLLDISMPAGNGFTVAERLQTLAETAATPIVFLTATHDLGTWQKARETGAFAFIQKPYEPEELLGTIREALAGQPTG